MTDISTIISNLETFSKEAVAGYETSIVCYYDNGPKYRIVITLSTFPEVRFEFHNEESAAVWAANLALLGPNAASVGLTVMRLEQEKANKIILDARVAALEKEVGEVGQTAPILDAQQAAAAIAEAADKRLIELAAEKEALEAEAAAKQAAADALQAEVDALKAAAEVANEEVVP